ncbi:MAG TPA: hypothetical protein VFC87_05805 [Perlabentimonas sp.]|nr:hypothetical protein [Perlabentimonas sp.]
MKQNSELMEGINLNEFTSKLKKEDERYASISKRFLIVFWIILPIYFVLIIYDVIVKASAAEIIGSVCTLLALLIAILVYRFNYKKYKYVDYSQSTLIMLKKAVYRYQPYQLNTLWGLLALLLLSVNNYINLSSSYSFAYFVGFIGLAILIGLLIWWIRYKPLYDGAKKLIREIEG